VRRLAKLAELSRAERGLLARAWILFLVADAGLLLMPFPSLLKLGHGVPVRRRPRAASSLPAIARLVWLVEVAARYAPGRATCLKQALVLSWLLRRRGISTTLQIGVARREGALAAHAWLERDGEVVFGHSGESFLPLLHARTVSAP
jgi:Transglutaminase-like superfamily